MDIKIVGKTSDLNSSDVWQCRTKTGSWMEGSLHKNMLYIWGVSSNVKGDFKKMMDAVTNKFKVYTIKFTSVISPNLMSILHGFKYSEEYHEAIEENVPCLTGKWKKEASRK